VKLSIGGGKERIESALTAELSRGGDIPGDPEGRRAWVGRVHARKTEIFGELVRGGSLAPRPGIVRVVDEAHAAGVRVAAASTSAEPSVRAILARTLGAERAAWFTVFAGDAVAHKKPHPAIYELALDRLGISPGEALAIEDSRNGLLAATAAGLRCAITVSSYTGGEDFSEATLVVSCLGDPGTPAEIFANRGRSLPHGLVRLDDLRALLD
jgi:HAD superfamily hydrolase (TIGR01509 family)